MLKRTKPALEVLENSKAEYNSFYTYNVDITKDERLPKYFNIKAVPEFIVCFNGREYKRIIGVDSEKLKTSIDQCSNKSP